jgi:ATP-dependent Lon protease
MEHGLKESLNRAWSYLKAVQDRLGLAPTLAQKDVVAEAIDLSGGHVECTCGVAFLVAMLSALGQRRVQAGTLVLLPLLSSRETSMEEVHDTSKFSKSCA